MQSVLTAIRAHRKLRLQIVVTGMHLDRSRGRTARSIDADAIVPWRGRDLAAATGNAMAELATVFEKLRTDIVLVVGDRVEAFAAAAAGSIGGRAVAHIHGGDRALGQVDDSLRHAITKLAHVHFPATRQSGARIARLGEKTWRIHRVGSPGIDGIVRLAAPRATIAKIVTKPFALAVLHPIDASEKLEHRRAANMIAAIRSAGVPRIVAIYPNNDPGSPGIVRVWERAKSDDFKSLRNLPRELFLGLLRDAAMLVGNSSSGIIEAASFGTPVVDVGDRQLGRERRADVRHVTYDRAAIAAAVKTIWNHGRPRRAKRANPYGGAGTGRKIAAILGRLIIDRRLLRKLIAY
jgi:GDP/UDP-N,N'-diacetylbacillosamine 2-epimerase (hydrolysing)